MTREQVESIVENKAFPGKGTGARLIETHISWVILTNEFAFKIKKPVKFDFLDFSTLRQREFFCNKELNLNKRLAKKMYLAVLPVGIQDGQHTIGVDPPVDYALQMKRMDNSLQMDKLLGKPDFPTDRLRTLAHHLASFHQRVVIKGPVHYAPSMFWDDYKDLFNWTESLQQVLGARQAIELKEMGEEVAKTLKTHDQHLLDRAVKGYWIEGHGDLHSRNIFMTDPPVAFDCIEFSKHFRQMDVLNEIAFLAMDLEFQNRKDLSDVFIDTYRTAWEVFPHPDDQWLFLFFKAYRANVRLKINLLEWNQTKNSKPERQVKSYAALLKNYLKSLQNL